MWQKLRRFYYDNKSIIIRTAIIVVLVILIIQGLNYYVGLEAGIYNNNVSINNKFTYGNLIDFGSTTNNSVYINGIDSNNNLIGSSNSVGGNNNGNPNTIGGNQGTSYPDGGNGDETQNIGNGNSNNDSLTGNEKAVNSFLDLCITGKTDEAYNMLTDECKSVLYSTIDKFKSNYYSKIFGGNKVYDVEQYYANTYKVKVSSDMNATGAYTSLASTDYITVINTNEGIKLNVGNYIGRNNINSSGTGNDITVTVNFKDVFIDYERYNITVKNGYEKIIMLNPHNLNKTMYVLDLNGNKNYAYIHEISNSTLILRSGSTMSYNIKYDGVYSASNSNKEKLIFDNIILDYNVYRQMKDTSNYSDIGRVVVDI